MMDNKCPVIRAIVQIIFAYLAILLLLCVAC